jgi:DNA repair protein RadA/Sms
VNGRRERLFVCGACGHETPKWLGRCPVCGEWNTISQESDGHPDAAAAAEPLAAVSVEGSRRMATGIGELDRVLGGGVVPGSMVLLGGEPGVGKSTLMLQAAAGLCAAGRTVVYAAGEESLPQVRARAERLGALHPRLLAVAETDPDRIAALINRTQPACMLVDSVQSLRDPSLSFPPGSIVQVREGAIRLGRAGKDHSVAVVLAGHINKEGALAGPKALEHLVDAVLTFEGERWSSYRLLRAGKNRFGSTQELGVFRMDESGLQEVSNPSQILLAERAAGVSGSAVVVAIEGTRPLLCEVQALLSGPAYGTPRRTAAGVDIARLALILAVLERRCGLRCGAFDAYVKVAGGVRLDEPAADLGLALALASVFRDRPLDPGTVVVGEVGLSGEVRGVHRAEERCREAARLGFSRCLLPAANGRVRAPEGMGIVPVASVTEALAAAALAGQPRG